MTTASPLILASASPRRRSLLARLGLAFAVVPSDVDEGGIVDPEPERLVRRLARAKADAVAATLPDRLVIGCDTVVVREARVIGKPASAAAARDTLRRLRGAAHQVYTGLAVVDRARRRTYQSAIVTTVVMADHDDAAIDRYVATGEPMDKAGSYAAQGEGARLIARIDGCYTNVVGLPLCELGRLLRLAGVALPDAAPICTGPDGRPCPRLAGPGAGG